MNYRTRKPQKSMNKTNSLQNFGLHTFRIRILISYIVVSLLPLTIFYLSVTNSLKENFIKERTTEVSRQANITASHVSAANYLLDESKRLLLDTDLMQSSSTTASRIIVTDSNGVVIGDSTKITDIDGKIIQGDIGKTYVVPEVLDALNQKDVKGHHDDIVSAASEVLDKDSNVVGVVLIYRNSTDIQTQLSAINSVLLIFTLVIIGVIIILSFWMSNIIVDPIKKILKVVQKMAEGHLEQRIKIKGKNEISELGNSFNVMAERLEKFDQIRKEFVSNVSHELKTPLSSIKVLSESILFQDQVPEEMYKEFLVDIKNEVDRMTDIINDLLDLVKLDRTAAPLKLSTVNLNNVIEGILKRLTPLAKQKNISLIFENLREVNLHADEVKLSLAITNLIENGIKYTPEGGMVTASVDADHQNAFIQVRDTGIGMKEDEVSKIFDRFYRIDKTRDRETGGSGLGLSITHSVILMHNGSIRVASKEDEGSIFSVRIPLNYTSS